jgi:hypothetical protein
MSSSASLVKDVADFWAREYDMSAEKTQFTVMGVPGVHPVVP